MTPTMLRVLRAIEKHDGCGINYLIPLIFAPTHRHMQLRAGQYMGRLVSKKLVRKTYNEYLDKRGRTFLCGVSYSLTELSRNILRKETHDEKNRASQSPA